MRANHIPQTERIQNKINKLKAHLFDDWRPYGRGNPYYYCLHCEQSRPYVSIEGHRKGCPMIGWEKDVEYYTNLLNKLKEETK